MCLILSFDRISVLVPDLKFSRILALTAEDAIVNSTGTNSPLANVVSTFFINRRPTFIKRLRSIPMNPPGCIVFDNLSFDNFYPLMNYS